MKKAQRSLVEEAKHLQGKYGGFCFGGNTPDGVVVKDPLPNGVIFPNGAKAAVLLTYDVEGNYGNGAGDQEKEMANYKRICDCHKKNNIPGSFFVVGKFAEEKGTDFVEVMLDAGCDVNPHGYVHDMNKLYGGDYIYAGHYGKKENFEQVSFGVDAINKIKPKIAKGFRLPYGHFNEYSYDALEECNLKFASHVGMDDFLVPGLGFGSQPFTMQLGDKAYPIVEIPLDSQTYDWAIWIAEEDSNAPFVNSVKKYCESKNMGFERTPSFGVKVWRRRIEDCIQNQGVFTALCHPINLTVQNDKWGDPVDEFMIPVIDMVGELSRSGKVWACTCSQMADFYQEWLKGKVGNGG